VQSANSQRLTSLGTPKLVPPFANLLFDFGFVVMQLTILATDNSPGLQLFLDNKWCDVPPMSDAFVINLGDLLERCVCSNEVAESRVMVHCCKNGLYWCLRLVKSWCLGMHG
jgi:2OG-Fe(II) oxygenase superfamily